MIKKMIIFFLKKISPIFFDKRYLCGKFFVKSNIGIIWVVRSIFYQKILGFNRGIPWMVSPFIKITNYKNVIFHPDNIDIFQRNGLYFQSTYAKIYLCKGVQIAPNVGIITSNHDIRNLDKRSKVKNVVIGSNSWIGMNTVVLPGVKLGPHTVVGANSVVTKSFREGYVVIAGNPAKVIKRIEI